MGGLYFEGQFISFKKLVDFNVTASSSFKNALTFCKDFLKGQSDFSVNTSGSTATPKTISLSLDQLTTSAKMTIKALNLGSDHTGLVCISTDHIGGKMMLVRGMVLGMNLHLVEPATILPIEKLPPIDFVALVPVQLQALLGSKEGRNFLDKCHAILIGGGQLNQSAVDQLDQFQAAFYQTYGMTETASHIALKRLNGPEKQANYQALEDIQLSVDSRGCLVVTGKITNHLPLVTNDLVQMTGPGKFNWLGRQDRAINTGGYKVIPEQLCPVVLESLRSLKIRCAFEIIGLPHSKWGEQVTLILEQNKITDFQAKQIIDLLRQKLQGFQVPKSIKCLSAFPRTTSGKPDIQRLQQMLRSNIHQNS